jgi:hypothetical protein
MLNTWIYFKKTKVQISFKWEPIDLKIGLKIDNFYFDDNLKTNYQYKNWKLVWKFPKFKVFFV